MNAVRRIPQVKKLPLLGNLLTFARNPHETMIRWHREYGDILGFRLGRRQLYLISHPGLVEQALLEKPDDFIKMYDPDRLKGLELVLGQGLVTSKGDLWRRQRRLIQPLFQRRHMADLYPQMVLAGQQLIGRWRGRDRPFTVNMSGEMLRLALEVLTRTLFSTSVLDRIEVISPALDCCLRYAASSVMNPFLPPLWVPTPGNRQFKQALAALDEIIYAMMAQRRSEPSEHDDLLSLLLAATDPETGEPMSDRQLRDELITLFTAGHETSANVLTWTLYYLAVNPGWQTRLREEARALFKMQAPDFARLEQLTLCRAVLMEAMRLRPPAGSLMRQVARNTHLDGYPLQAGALAVMSIYNIHHHQRLWDNPEQFDPGRFIDGKPPKSTFIPFGIGHRFCVGNQFALTELLMLLTVLVKNFEFTHQGPPPVVDMAVTLRPKGGLNLTVTPLE